MECMFISDDVTECEAYNATATIETSSDEEETVPKRQHKKKKFSDCVTGKFTNMI